MRMAVNTRAGHRPDDRPEWKHPRGRPRQTWIRQLGVDVGLTADAAWDMASDLEVWRAQRPVADQVVRRVSDSSKRVLRVGDRKWRFTELSEIWPKAISLKI